MPILNGDATEQTGPMLSAKLQDPSTALQVLEKDYTQGDGIDVHTLLDSKKNGGLTYNDFLMLPGYIGTVSH